MARNLRLQFERDLHPVRDAAARDDHQHGQHPAARLRDRHQSSDATPADNSCGLGSSAAPPPALRARPRRPVALDSGEPAAQVTTGLAVFSVGPTLTASSFPWKAVVYQRGAYRWVAAPTKEIVLPATANNGLALMALVTNGSAYNLNFGLTWEE
jgi:hypothetical protein